MKRLQFASVEGLFDHCALISKGGESEKMMHVLREITDMNKIILRFHSHLTQDHLMPHLRKSEKAIIDRKVKRKNRNFYTNAQKENWISRMSKI